MKITSKVTYVLPFLVLLIPAWYLSGLWTSLLYLLSYKADYTMHYILALGFMVVNAVLLFLAFVKLAPKVKPIVFKIIVVAFPVIVCIIFSRNPTFILLSFVPGLIMLYAYSLFNTRYIATLTDTSIQYKNLLGHVGEIPLTSITSLEQKKNVLSFFRYGRVLDISKKTGVGFRDENLDEYEINLFMRVWQHNSIFEKIIQNTNRAGNLKVRQYTM